MLLLALALPAHAVDYSIQDHLPKLGIKPSAVTRNPGSYSLEGVVEVPLYDDGDVSTRAPSVELTLPDGTRQLVGIDLGVSTITLTEGTVTALGGEVKERKVRHVGMTKVATVDFELGDASFRGVTVEVGSSDNLGLLAFQGLSVGLFPSEGVVRLADAGGLTLDGASVPYTRIEAEVHKDGTRRPYTDAHPTLVTGTWNDQPVTIRLRFADTGGSVASQLVADAAPTFERGGVGVYSGAVEIEGLPVATGLFDETNSNAYSFEPHEITVGAGWTSRWDVVFDGQGTLTVKPAEAANRVSWLDTELEQALEGLEKPEDADDDWKVSAGAHSAVAAVYAKQGRYDDAVASAKKALAADEEPLCTAYTGLAAYQGLAGDHEGARESYTQGLALYDTWGDLDAKRRVDILAEKAEVEAGVKLFGLIPIVKPGEWEGEVVQPHACDASRKDLLWTLAILGDWDEVDRIWTEDRDIEAGLGHAATSAFLAQGRWDEAFAALSWSVSNGRTSYYESWVPLAYALIQDQQGKADQAWRNYERALGLAEDTELLTVRAYAAAHSARNGREATAKHLATLSGASPHLKLVQAEALQGAGQDATAGYAAAVAAYRQALVIDPGQAAWHAGLSSALLRSGDLDGAREAAQAALAADAQSPLAHLAMGDVLVMSGDDAASDHYRFAAAAGDTNPLLATML